MKSTTRQQNYRTRLQIKKDHEAARILGLNYNEELTLRDIKKIIIENYLSLENNKGALNVRTK